MHSNIYKAAFLTIATVIVAAAAFYTIPLMGADPGATVSRPVPVAEVRVSNSGEVREFPGKVRAKRRVELAFSVPGLISRLDASEGSRVKKGEVIARLDDRDYRYALDIASASHEEAHSVYLRKEKLLEEKVISKADFDRAEAGFRIAEGELELRRKALKDTVLRAPFDGVIARRYVENHEHIQAQVPVVSLQDVSSVEVIAQLPEILVAQHGIANLHGVQVNFDADGERWFDAEVLEFSSQADPTTRTFDVVVKLTPPENLQILPGMTAAVKVSFANGRHDTAGTTLVPVEAVWGGNAGQSYVWVINETTGRAVKTPVTVGAFRNSELEILTGLEHGQKVAVAGIKYLNETMAVRPMSDHVNGLDR